MLGSARQWTHASRNTSTVARIIRRNLHNSRNLVEELTARDLIADVTKPDQLQKHLDKAPQTVYAGIDPTAKALHAGHLLPIMCLLHFQLQGNNVIALVGGATGLVGDPSGRMTERELFGAEQIGSNAVKLTEVIQKFFERAATYAASKSPTSHLVRPQPQVLNNTDWLKDIKLLEFLRTAGTHFRVNHMLARDSVRTRMSAQQGMNFAEFTYQLLQGYDFYELYRTQRCTIQVGGSDQWGNILSGLELIHKAGLGESAGSDVETLRQKAFALTTPLLTTSSGEKFGKSAGNAVWLDESLTSHFDFYQFFIRTADEDVEKYLKMFTLVPVEEITAVMRDHRTHPEHRIAQRLLAEEVTLLVHGEDGLAAAEVATGVLFGTDYSSLRADQIIKSLQGDSRLVFCSEGEMFHNSLPSLAATHKLLPSNSAARQLVLTGGFYLNNTPQRDPYFRLTRDHLLDGRVAIVRAGKDKHLVLILR